MPENPDPLVYSIGGVAIAAVVSFVVAYMLKRPAPGTTAGPFIALSLLLTAGTIYWCFFTPQFGKESMWWMYGLPIVVSAVVAIVAVVISRSPMIATTVVAIVPLVAASIFVFFTLVSVHAMSYLPFVMALTTSWLITAGPVFIVGFIASAFKYRYAKRKGYEAPLRVSWRG